MQLNKCKYKLLGKAQQIHIQHGGKDLPPNTNTNVKDSPLLKEATLLADCPDHSQRALKQQDVIHIVMEIYHYIHIIQDMYIYINIYRALQSLLRMI